MESKDVTPRKIERFSESEMRIEWTDHTSSQIPFRELRFQCPCAGCVNEITGERMIRRESISENVQPVQISTVGRYAIKIDWNDGHSTGMYAFDRLKEICDSLSPSPNES